MELTEVIKKPVITEKSTRSTAQNQYTFEVARGATKRDIASAVEELFGVEVWRVKVMNRRGKRKRAGKKRLDVVVSSIRRAIVTVEPGKRIELFEVGEKE